MSIRTVIRILAAPAIIYFVSEVFVIVGIFDLVPEIDNPFHLIGGIAIVCMWWQILRARAAWRRILDKEPLLVFALLVGLTAITAIFWEAYEFLHDIVFCAHLQGNVADTISDMTLGLTGGVLAAVWLLRKRFGKFNKRLY